MEPNAPDMSNPPMVPTEEKNKPTITNMPMGTVETPTRLDTSNTSEDWRNISELLTQKGIDVSSWNKGSFDSTQDSVSRHFEKHGKEVGAEDVEQYMRKATEFARNLRGAQKYNVDGAVEGVKRYVKNGKYIDLAPDGTIISFGKR